MSCILTSSDRRRRINPVVAFLAVSLLVSACGDAPESVSATAAVPSGEMISANTEPGASDKVPAPERPDEFNNYNISRDGYVVDPGFITEGRLLPGDGLDMSEPGAPKRRVGMQPLDLAQAGRMAGTLEDYTLSESFRLQEAASAKSEAKILSAYFQGSYGFVSGEAALEQASEERSSSHSIYAVMESKGQVQDIQAFLGDKPLAWNAQVRPIYEGTDVDSRTFRRQFLLDYGSHYVSAITYGYRVAIRGKMTQTDSSSQQKIKAAFKAAFVAGSAEGGISAEDRKTLSSNNLELVFAATSGGLYEDDQRRPGILTNLDDILKMLEDMKAGRIKIHEAPLSATARTYWNLLPADYTNSRELLADRAQEPLPEPFFGVPKGTVIPWKPPASAVKTDNAGNERLVPPPGWALCNGEDGAPDLRDRFVRGTMEPAAVSSLAGDVNHTHPDSTSKAPGTGGLREAGGGGSGQTYAMKGHTHAVAMKAAAIDPPHVKLAFIMKL